MMPYIADYKRAGVSRNGPTDAGELNYAITKLLDSYLIHEGLNYKNINDCLGACEGAKLEFYRRVAVPYEDKKIAENGDVYNVETGD